MHVIDLNAILWSVSLVHRVPQCQTWLGDRLMQTSALDSQGYNPRRKVVITDARVASGKLETPRSCTRVITLAARVW